MSFFNVDNVVKASGSSSGTINTTFSAPDLAFDYLAAGEQLNITYMVQLDDHAGGVTTQNVAVTVIGTNDKPIYLCGPETGASDRGPERLAGRQSHRARRPALHRHRSVRHAHGLDHRHGGALGRRRDPALQCALLAAFYTSLDAIPPAICSAMSTGISRSRTTRRASSPPARR